jgi:serine O-acetyltransferase
MSSERGVLGLLLADLTENWRHRGRDRAPSSWVDVVRSLADVRFLPVVLLRLTSISTTSESVFGKIGSRAFGLVNRVLFGVECAPQAVIGPGLYFPHTGGIVIGAAEIGARCILYHQVTLGAKTIDMPFTPSMRPHLGDDVTVAAGAKVLGGVSVGAGAVVAANAVVVHDVAPGSVVGGIPAAPLS